MSESVWITATPPTPNGPLHVGHLAGPYVAADVLRRYLAADGVPVVLTTGLDDHQSYVAVRGERERRREVEVADDYGRQILEAWSAAQIAFDRVGRPRVDANYPQLVQSVFTRLYRSGDIVARERALPYCAACERWLFEAYLQGRCPHCREECGGNVCEACGRPNDCGDVLDPRCALCAAPAAGRPCARLFMALAPFTGRLREFWLNVEMAPHLRALCESMLHDGLPEIAVSHPSSWGLRVPLARFRSQTIFAWFEMALGYLLERDAHGRPPAQGPVQLFGFDNGYFHAVLMPAVYMAHYPRAPLPRTFIVNEFYRLEGEKFSTSRNHAIWARQALADAGSDAVRFHVLRDRPSGRQTNFNRGDLSLTRRHLQERWNRWLEALLGAVHGACGGEAPREPPSGPAWSHLAGRLRGQLGELRDAYSITGFDPRRATALLDEMVACCADFADAHEFERLRPGAGEAYRSSLSAQLAAACALAAWAAPVLPAGARRLASLLGLTPDRPVSACALSAPAPGTRCGVPSAPIFGAL